MFTTPQKERLISLTNILQEIVKNKWDGEVIASVCAGSYAYGLQTETSDLDLRGIHSVSLKHLLKINPVTSQSKDATIEINQYKEENIDINSVEVAKFCHLCLKCNPSILEILFIPDEMIVQNSDFFELLRDYKLSFINKKQLIAAYIGYATAQIERMIPQEIKKCKFNLFKCEELTNFVNETNFEFNSKNAMHGFRLIKCLSHALEYGEILVNLNDYPEIINILKTIRQVNIKFSDFMT